MKSSRRTFLKHSLGATAFAAMPGIKGSGAAAYARLDIDARLADGRGLEGLTKHDLPTPSLILDLDVFEANLDRMSRHARATAIDLRPHAKTHKCVEVAKRQITAGALGVCVATIHEAEAMATGDIGGLLITSEMVGADKIGRLVRLTQQHGDTMSVVDHPGHAEQLNKAAAAADVRLNVLIDIDPGNHRTGIAPGAPAKALARQVAKLRHLKLRGIHSYAGRSSHELVFAARRAHSREAMAPSIETFVQLRQEGLPLEIFTGGSTGTYNIDSELEAMTELQVGSYVFMDVDYRRIGGKSGAAYDDFGQALSVIATVISKSQRDLATVDAGFKAFATDFGPEVKGVTGVGFRWAGDEHSILEIQKASRGIDLGDRIEFVVPHCDPNVNLYDQIYCLRQERVGAVWPVSARGHG